MIELILGIVCGIALSLLFSFGPAFFSQLRTSIQYGFKKSYPFAFGVSAGDVIIVFLVLTVFKNVNLYEVLHNVWVASIGGAVLLIMGIHSFSKEVDSLEGKESRIKFKEADTESCQYCEAEIDYEVCVFDEHSCMILIVCFAFR